MAALDFPAAPTDGQYFVAPNNITYQYSAALGLWRASPGNLSSPGGDVSVASYVAPGAGSFVTFVNVLTGNAGGWYNTSNGRYTPPAGRYLISCGISMGNNGTPVLISMDLYKNGTYVHRAQGTTLAAGNYDNLNLTLELDANGTDYFQVWCGANGTGANLSLPGYFTATPISGIKGPTGDQGPAGPGNIGLVLASEHVLSSPGNQMTVTFPAGAKRVDLDFWWTTSPLTDIGGGGVGLQGMSGGSPVTTATYNSSANYFRSDGSSAGAFTSGQTYFSVQGGWAQAHGHINFMRPDAGYGVMSGHGLTAGGARYQMHGSYEGAFAAGSFTGYRLQGGSVNFAIGSFLRCWAA